MYSFQSKVRYSETDETGRLNLDAVINYFQDCSVFQSESLGLGVEYLKERSLAWVMTAWQIVIKEYPRFYEDIKVATFPYGFKGFIGYRNFFMENAKGEKLVTVNSVTDARGLEYNASGKTGAGAVRRLCIRRKAGYGICAAQNYTSGVCGA